MRARQASDHPLLAPAALLAVAALTSARSRLAGRGGDDEGDEDGAAARAVDVWARRAAMLWWAWLLLAAR